MMDILRAIFAGIVCGDFLLAGVIFLLTERRETNIPQSPPHSPPETHSGETDAQRHIRQTKEDAEAWRQMQNYSVKDAYGSDGG